MTGILYVVSTPIGNLGDITLRAIETLKSVDLIASEDTRTTSILLEKYSIKTKTESYHKFSESKKASKIIELLKEGLNVALVSDAGTPLISDPGGVLIGEANKNNIKVVPIGGISAVITLLSSIQKEGEDFKFIGFLPRIKAQIEEIITKNQNENLVFYESPKRIQETLEIIKEKRTNSLISIGRELTKKFEEIKTLKIEDMIEFYKLTPKKGEMVCMIHKEKTDPDETILKEKIKALKGCGFSQKDTVKILEITDNINKNRIKSLYNS